jgi:hypothetical protein
VRAQTARWVITTRRCSMADVFYVALVLVFFGLSWAFVKLCERV